jgi:hypothetical protein
MGFQYGSRLTRFRGLKQALIHNKIKGTKMNKAIKDRKIQHGEVLFRHNDGEQLVPATVIGDGSTVLSVMSHRELGVSGIGMSFGVDPEVVTGFERLLLFTTPEAIDDMMELLGNAKNKMIHNNMTDEQRASYRYGDGSPKKG